MLFTCLFLSSLNYAELSALQLNGCEEVCATPAAFLEHRSCSGKRVRRCSLALGGAAAVGVSLSTHSSRAGSPAIENLGISAVGSF